MGDFLIIPCLNCIKITQKQAWRSLIYFAWMKSMYFREYVCRFSRKLHYFCILGVSHLNSLALARCGSNVNSLAPGTSGCNLELVISKLISKIDIMNISNEIVIRLMPQDLTDDKSTMVQVMAWCHQAPSHYLGQCWHRSVSPHVVTRPQWVKSIIFKITVENSRLGIHEIVLSWMPQNYSSEKSTVV